MPAKRAKTHLNGLLPFSGTVYRPGPASVNSDSCRLAAAAPGVSRPKDGLTPRDKSILEEIDLSRHPPIAYGHLPFLSRTKTGLKIECEAAHFFSKNPSRIAAAATGKCRTGGPSV